MAAKFGEAMSWLIVAVALFLGAGPGFGCVAWAEDGLEPAANAVGGLSEAPSASAVAVEASAAAPLAGAEPDRERVEEAERGPQAEPADAEEYDPWEPFNERMFTVNRELDHYALKPVATAWNAVVPEEIQQGLGRAFDNLFMPRRFVNCLLQGKLAGAGRELGRFVLNSTLGLVGLFDAGKDFGLPPCDEDTGQTLAVWGVGAGPYLVLPLLPPLTVRDGIGLGVDGLLNPINWVAPFVSVGVRATEAVNSRSQHLEVFEDVEEGTLDMYSAVRNGYLQRRARAIQE
jgi:phospholipid-binding lipoprotein MlaA